MNSYSSFTPKSRSLSIVSPAWNGHLLRRMAAMALMACIALASCSSDDERHEESAVGIYDTGRVIGFSSYVMSSQTRAGDTGLQTDALLQAAGKGFGVFAYYTEDGNYDAATVPNFMYNQQVTYNGGSTHVTPWEYQPQKFWPNDFSTGAVDDQTAPATGSHNGSRLSFFAYAPYVARPADDPSYGITALSPNSEAGDPKVTYKVGATPDKCVDLLWGVVNSGIGPTTISATPLSEGLPWCNITKQTTTGRVDFLFRHALAQLNFFTYLEIDNILDFESWEKDDAGEAIRAWRSTTKVTVESVAIRAATGSRLYETGQLNLNNDKVYMPRWENCTGNTTLTLDAPHVTEALRDPAPDPDKIGTLLMNRVAITGVTAMADLRADDFVTPTDAQALNTAPLMMIPEVATPNVYEITITYYVTTTDPKLLDGSGYQRTKNVITKVFQLTDPEGNPVDFQANQRYYLGLGLGLSTVKFSVYGGDWADGDSSVAPLPVNIITEHGTSADRALAPRRR